MKSLAVRQLILLTVIYGLWTGSPRPSFGDSPTEFYVRQALDRYFPVPTDAIVLSMGNSTLPICSQSGASCAYMNPAALGRMRQYQVAMKVSAEANRGEEFLSEEKIEQSQHTLYGVVGMPLHKKDDADPDWGALSIGYSRYIGRTNDRLGTTPDGYRRTLGYGIALSDETAIGYSLTFYDDQLHNDLADLHSHARFLHIFGFTHQLAKTLTLGGVFNLGIGQSDTEDYIYRTNALSHSKQFSGSLALQKTWSRLSGAFSVGGGNLRQPGDLDPVPNSVVFGSNEAGDFINGSLGAQYLLSSAVALRVGTRYGHIDYQFRRKNLRDLSGDVDAVVASGGAGYSFSEQQGLGSHIDYGTEYVLTGNNVWRHLISFVFAF